MILGYELGKSCKAIPASTWENDGVLSNILGPLMVKKMLETGYKEEDISTAELGIEGELGIIEEIMRDI